MKKTQVFKSALDFQIKSILFEKKNPDTAPPYPLKYTQRQTALHIAKSSGICVFTGINILIFIFLVFRFVSSPVLLALFTVLFTLLTVVQAQLSSTLYLFFIFLNGLKSSDENQKVK